MKRRIVLLGPPASGKGTQAEMIGTKYQIPSASPGAILRDEKNGQTALGAEAAGIADQGRLLPDEVVNRLVKSWIVEHGDAFVLDGYPRSLGQAAALDELLSERAHSLDAVLSLEVDEATIRDRVERRQMCSACGRTFRMGWQVETAAGVCRACGGKLIKRADDNLETLGLRMREYAEKTAPLAAFYTERRLLFTVDAARPAELVFQSIADILENR